MSADLPPEEALQTVLALAMRMADCDDELGREGTLAELSRRLGQGGDLRDALKPPEVLDEGGAEVIDIRGDTAYLSVGGAKCTAKGLTVGDILPYRIYRSWLEEE